MNAAILRAGYKLSEIYLAYKQSWANENFESSSFSDDCGNDKELENLYKDFDRLSRKHLKRLLDIGIEMHECKYNKGSI